MSFLYKLFFTRNDDLDVLQLVFLCWVTFVGITIAKVGSGAWSVPTAAWSVMASVFATLAICGTPTWIAQLLANRKETPVASLYATDAPFYGVDRPADA